MCRIEKICTESGVRLDVVVSSAAEVTRSYATKLIENGCVTVNGSIVAKNYKIKSGDALCVTLPDPESCEVIPQNIPLDIVYEDNDLLVVNKPKGMVVHPAVGNSDGTLVNALLHHCGNSLSGINGVMRPGILHRIDKDTSGLIMVAKNDTAHHFLSEQIKEHTFTREYEAVVYGKMREASGKIDAPIGRHSVKRKQMAVTDKGSRPAVTHFTVLRQGEKFAHLRLRLETGRTHQIRVHMAYIGHPVAGDPVYGPKNVIKQLCGQCLHARKIGFVHPSTHEYMEFTSDLPQYFTDFLERNIP